MVAVRLGLPDHVVGAVLTPQESAWNQAVAHLASLGWEPVGDDFDVPMVEGKAMDGHEAFALHRREPIPSQATIEGLAQARTRLAGLAGVLA